ncbi:hypothetical protein [Prosthecobacter dejongeii]|uniref:Uncharacterized protein n=1 Tax=Prosthecobacter dejongeii TaxID=48465 RepID=A0A7W7YI84_9BACT|nr:hypothetical protein [Prosthecobacter dejongeii]MBB5036614.1 hypothetical protein [Prosthecobacter dejongeii]
MMCCHSRWVLFLGALYLSTSLLGTLQAQDEDWQIELTLGKDGWRTYQNPRFGAVIPVPPGLVALEPPTNGDGQAFATPDGKVRLAVYGCFNVEGTADLDVRWKDDLVASGRTITYQRKTDSWYVISGVMEDGTGFYEKYTANAKYGSGWRMTYPQKEEKKYSAWIERIAKGYQPRLGQGFDTLE